MQSSSKPNQAGSCAVRGPRGIALQAALILACLLCVPVGAALAGPRALPQPPENPAEIHAVIVRVSWTTLRAGPSPKGKAIGIAYGNDAFPVLERKPGWVRVRLTDHRLAWLPEEALEDEAPLPATSVADAAMPAEAAGPGGAVLRPPPVVTQLPELHAPALSVAQQELLRAQGLQASGFRAQAREAYLGVILRHPATTAFYQAVRGMNFYYPLGDFPRVVGDRLPKDGMARAEAKLPELFIREGETCLKEARPLDAAASFELALLHGGEMWERATSGLKDALGTFLTGKPEAQPAEARELARSLWRDYFPGEPLPKGTVVASAAARAGDSDPGAGATP